MSPISPSRTGVARTGVARTGVARPSWLNSMLADLRNLWLPRQCVVCGSWGEWLCSGCNSSFEDAPAARDVATVCRCSDGIHVVSALPYEHATQKIVLSFKDRGIRALSFQMARAMVPVIREAAELDRERPEPSRETWLVPVPPRARSVRRRGFDHLSVLGNSLISQLEPGYRWRPILQWRRGGGAQKRLTRIDRSHNVTGRIRFRRGFVPAHSLIPCLPTDPRVPTAPGVPTAPDASSIERPRPQILLLDDVVTTGQTLAECHRVFCMAGIRAVVGVTLCSVGSRP